VSEQNPAGSGTTETDEDFASRASEAAEAAKEGDSDRSNLAVTELLAKVAERTNELQQARTEVSERTADLQRLQAEYVNYRKRVERDRVAVKEIALQNVITELLPVLDDIGRAREHDELHGGFQRVAESLENVVAKLGVQQFGAKGDVFDPQIHEALMHTLASDVTEDTCVEILQPGYRIGERIVRPARVTVAEPDPSAPPSGLNEAPDDDDASPAPTPGRDSSGDADDTPSA
jgi:molecular chaperone GrpE